MAGQSHKERILEAGARIFYRHGYEAATVQNIVEAARVNAPTLYHHFGSKQGLAMAYVERIAEQENRRFAFLADMKSFKSLLNAWADVLRRDVERDEYCGCPVGNFIPAAGLTEEDPGIEAIRAGLDEIQKGWVQGIKAKLDEFKAAGKIASSATTESIARRLLISYEGALLMWRMSRDPAFIDDLKRQFTAIYEQYRPRK